MSCDAPAGGGIGRPGAMLGGMAYASLPISWRTRTLKSYSHLLRRHAHTVLVLARLGDSSGRSGSPSRGIGTPVQTSSGRGGRILHGQHGRHDLNRVLGVDGGWRPAAVYKVHMDLDVEWLRRLVGYAHETVALFPFEPRGQRARRRRKDRSKSLGSSLRVPNTRVPEELLTHDAGNQFVNDERTM